MNNNNKEEIHLSLITPCNFVAETHPCGTLEHWLLVGNLENQRAAWWNSYILGKISNDELRQEIVYELDDLIYEHNYTDLMSIDVISCRENGCLSETTVVQPNLLTKIYPLLAFKLVIDIEPIWFIAAKTILEAVELWYTNERSVGHEDKYDAKSINVTMCDDVQLKTIMIFNHDGIKRPLGDVINSMNEAAIISCSEW